MPNILYLTLKKEWYDMIESGEKPEEYREVKEYWIKRFIDTFNSPEEIKDENKTIPANILYDLKFNRGTWDHVVECYYSERKDFDYVRFARGGHFHPSIPQMTFVCTEINIGRGNPEWGAPNEDVFVIKLGQRI